MLLCENMKYCCSLGTVMYTRTQEQELEGHGYIKKTKFDLLKTSAV